jgi:hypothetical protein
MLLFVLCRCIMSRKIHKRAFQIKLLVVRIIIFVGVTVPEDTTVTVRGDTIVTTSLDGLASI